MFSRTFVRYVRRNNFSLPAYNFKYAQQDVDTVEDGYATPLFPTDDKDRRQHKGKVKETFKVLDHGENDPRKPLESSSKVLIKRPVNSHMLQEDKHHDKIRNTKKRKQNDNEKFEGKYKENMKFEGKYSNFNRAKKDLRNTFKPLGEMIFGIHPIYLALQARRREIHQLYYKEGLETKNVKVGEILELAKQCNLQVNPVKLLEMKQMLGEDRVHQGICCDVEPLSFEKLETQSFLTSEDENTQKSKGRPYQLWLYMDRIQDPMNFGAILRSAYFMGVDKVLTSSENSCRLSGVVSKASAGAAEVLPVYQAEDLKNLFLILSNKGWNLVSTAADSSPCAIPLHHYMPRGNMVVAVGNEGFGISADLQELFKTTITIQPGCTLGPGMDSLNVSVATAVILHDLTAKLLSLEKENTQTT